ncbi:MAG TPA: hypothetical protein VLJ10_04810, partial [Candidatus Bathyarchaeia archaeon]|nr:hypothetical protein [Candidatus Bathyarchaeia archaeon]
VNAVLFSQLGDRISGAIEVQGLMSGVEHGHLDIGLNKDGEIQAALLEPLLAYIPNSVQKKNIEAAIQKNRRVHVNSAALTLVDRDPETVSVDIRLKSAELSLDVNMVVDIIIEGGIQGLWQFFPSIFQLLKGS